MLQTKLAAFAARRPRLVIALTTVLLLSLATGTVVADNCPPQC